MMADIQFTDISCLDREHIEVFRQALTRILSTEVAGLTYAEIIDGLPTEKSFLEFHPYKEGHPVFELHHASLCSGVIDRIWRFRDRFDPQTLTFPQPASFLRVYSLSSLYC